MLNIPTGKLPADLLRELLKKYATCDSRVVVGPGIGQDAAIIDMGDRYLVAKTDPAHGRLAAARFDSDFVRLEADA